MRKIWNGIINFFTSLRKYCLYTGHKPVTIEQSLRSKAPGRSNDMRDVCARALLKSEDKDEFMKIFYWARQLVAILLGVVYGSLPLKGTLALLLFFGLNIGIVYLYAVNRQNRNKNNKAYICPWELMKNGFITSSVGFAIVWLIIFRTMHTNTLIAAYSWAK